MAKTRGAAPHAQEAKAPKSRTSKGAEPYRHPDKTSPMRPDVGTQPQFRKKKPPKTYRYDSSLSPALEWDGQNPVREQGEEAIREIQDGAAEIAKTVDLLKSVAGTLPLESEAAVRDALAHVHGGAEKLRRLSRPFLNWAGKAERLSFDVPTLPLFVHERLSTKAIVETLVGHKRDRQLDLYEMFGDPKHSIADQTLRAYEYQDKWVNRLILGDSLVVMSSLLQYEGLGGQVQMIYIDPPYGVKFGSNFQPFVRKRDVSHNDDEDLTREPEMVKAYRDTWELGLHSYLTYMRDRLLLARDLLTPSGSVFVQISDENVHHVRELMDEVFGAENFVTVITFAKTSGFASSELPVVADFLVWYARDKEHLKYKSLFVKRSIKTISEQFKFLEDPSGTVATLSREQIAGREEIPAGRRFAPNDLASPGESSETFVVEFSGRKYSVNRGTHWRTTQAGIETLRALGRLFAVGDRLAWKRYDDDFPFVQLTNTWSDTAQGGLAIEKLYVVQTVETTIERCILMTTDPGDLVLDPTCGSGTTAYVAEQWGRRWVTIDTSRVPLALARQRLLTATYPYYQLKEEKRGPAGGFVYVRKQNKKGEEVGGIVPHVTLKSIANSEPPDEEVLVDRPEVDNKFVRVTGPFAFEATIPTPVDWEGDGVEDSGSEQAQSYGSFVERMIEVLRRSPVLHVGGGKTVNLANVRQPAKSLSLSAEAIAVNGVRLPAPSFGEGKPDTTDQDLKSVALVFGPENGAISERLVHGALQEANLKRYSHLYVIGFAIQPHARQLIDGSTDMGLLPATYVQATPDLMMGDLLKNMRSSQIFSVCGLPEVNVHHAKPEAKDSVPRYQVELVGLDTFDPTTMSTDHRGGDDVPAWFLDTDYNNLCFHVSQAFFPRTGAWSDLRKALKGDYDDSVWDHLAGTMSAPFEAGEHSQIAVKVIDDRGNELLVVKVLP